MMASNFPLVLIFILGAVLLVALPRRMRPWAFLAAPVVAFIFLIQLEPGATLTLPFLNFELVITRIDRLSLAFGYVFVIMSFLGGVYGFHRCSSSGR
jgi:multicomponent Na+:H+ antiporter subunit D